MKQIAKSNPLEKDLENRGSVNPNQVFTMKDVLSTKDTKKKERKDTTVRVFQDTRLKLNLLNQFADTDNVDDLINKMMDEFIPTNMSKENKKLFNMMLEIEMKKLQ
ncbi:hypothetical protein ACFVRU_35110 [Streptomyces sp. NPDC057927]